MRVRVRGEGEGEGEGTSEGMGMGEGVSKCLGLSSVQCSYTQQTRLDYRISLNSEV